MLLYYITDRKQFSGGKADQRRQLLANVTEAARAEVDYIQLREKDLSPRELESLAKEVLSSVRDARRDARLGTRVLINSRTDIALACGADGVHLTSNDISPGDARSIAVRMGEQNFIVAVSCHRSDEVLLAEAHGADFAVLAPIFGKVTTDSPGIGLAPLRTLVRQAAPDNRVEAGDARTPMPVLALGGVTLENAKQCIEAGAAGIAGIRLFQENEVAAVVRTLRGV